MRTDRPQGLRRRTQIDVHAGRDDNRAGAAVQADLPPPRCGFEVVARRVPIDERIEVAVVAKLDECGADRRIDDAGGPDGNVAGHFESFEEEGADGDGAPEAVFLDPPDL